ncbi:MAG TPA: hypothetical protein VKE22_27940 [Haliangiales bacterium]|nr:hypothetical protein [Haliangiales bacterium]
MKARHIVSFAAVGALAGAGFYVYSTLTAKDRTIAEQKRVIVELGKRLERAWASELVADLRVNRIERAPDGQTRVELTFLEYQSGTETPSFRKDFSLPGDEVYIDGLVVQFERPYVEAADGLRGRSLLLFRRAFGDRQQPVDGVPLYEAKGEIPVAYQVDAQPSEFERSLWADFWTLANDPARAKQRGVRVAQGEAPHVKAVAGQVYKITLRASGGLEMTPRIPAAALPKQ